MRKFISLEDQDNICKQNGEYKKLAYVNRQQIKSLLENAQISINSANLVAGSIDKKDSRWMTVYTGYYEAIKVANHQCLFAYLCKNHPEFQFDWDFFEDVRFNRNGVYYYGKKITYAEWENAKPKFNLYIPALKKSIDKKLS